MPVVALLAATSGALLGAAADRLAARWPQHEIPAARRIDWRTISVAIGAGAAFAGLLLRWHEPRDVLILGAYFTVLIVLLATDLDQRLLPDVLTLPMAAAALCLLVAGVNPLLAGKELGFVSGLAAGVGAPMFLLVTDRLLGGGLGMGDVKLAIGLGLMSGASRLFAGFLIASAICSVLIIALIAAKRLGLRSAIPFGPILILGGFLAALLP